MKTQRTKTLSLDLVTCGLLLVSDFIVWISTSRGLSLTLLSSTIQIYAGSLNYKISSFIPLCESVILCVRQRDVSKGSVHTHGS